ncbi:MAG: autotransporter assembly complex protein TamA [Pseudomonadota bacterium]|nr:autotransporter assembly complex protein TamA [Pseudomonadota bacterium]
MPPIHTFIAAALLLLACGAVHAIEVGEVDVRGLDEIETANVRTALSMVDAIGQDVSSRRFDYLLREAENETREALEPFGYYDPKITIERVGEGDPAQVVISVEPGVPVRVRRADVAILGEGSGDRYLREDLEEFEPETGDVFDHERYESSKTRISRRLAERGYFDADFASRRVEVTRAERAADIDLVWESGPRYSMGAVTFQQVPNTIIRESLLDQLVYWDDGSYYHEGKLDRLRRSLERLDYFSRIDIERRPQDAQGTLVPVTITLEPAKRSIYTAGLSFGTDSGAGIRLGLERRYLNQRGHKALARLDFAQRRKTLTLQYRIPAFALLDGWYTFSTQAADEQTDFIDTRRIEFVASRSGEINQHLTAIASLHALRERWTFVEEADDGTLIEPSFRYATFTYASLRAEYVDADDLIFPRDGRFGTIMLRGGVEGFGSDADFAQVRATAQWYKGVGQDNRLILRGELGRTFTDLVVDVPPSLRFFAGGDRSIRGYAWREVGPRIVSANGEQFALGGKNVATASVEFERYFSQRWGAAVFVDSGTAFNDSPDWRTGVGIGLRWRSPVGPVQVDIARGLDDPDSSFQLYLGIGTGL